MRHVEPEVRLIARPGIDWDQIKAYLYEIGGLEWHDRKWTVDPGALPVPGESLIEFSGRLCYRSWSPGLNVNVSKVRTDPAAYFENLLKSGHGSVLEHANYSFVLHNVSRVLSHEIVRHRAGTAISQESMRFVRLTDIPFWFPEWAREDEYLMEDCLNILEELEALQKRMAEHFKLDAVKPCDACVSEGYVSGRVVEYGSRGESYPTERLCPKCGGNKEVSAVPFAEKKAKTSFMRRFAPDGVATGMVWTANVRALRHVITMRTDAGAEEEIRLVLDKVAEIMARECPLLFGDYEKQEDGSWVTPYRKV